MRTETLRNAANRQAARLPISERTIAWIRFAGVAGFALATAASAAAAIPLPGTPVFAAGNWGLSTVFGATGGYLIGFLLAQPVIGLLTKPPVGTWSHLLPALLLGNAIIFACGLTWLSLWSGAGVQQALAWGLWPFVPGLILKTGLALGLGRFALQSARACFS